MAKSKIVKNGQLYPGILDFTTNLNIPDVPPSNPASFGHPLKSYLTSHFLIGIHFSYGHCTSSFKLVIKINIVLLHIGLFLFTILLYALLFVLSMLFVFTTYQIVN